MARRFPLLLLLLVAPAHAAEVTVNATRSGNVLQVEARAEFRGDRARTWRILTDYGRLADFVPDLHVSRVVSRDRNSVVVEQKGEVRFLVFSYPVDVRLAITEHPRERVVSRAIAGNFRELQGTYTLETRRERVLLRYSGRMAPDFQVPPVVGTFVLRRHVELTFGALVREIERQHAKPVTSDR